MQGLLSNPSLPGWLRDVEEGLKPAVVEQDVEGREVLAVEEEEVRVVLGDVPRDLGGGFDLRLHVDHDLLHEPASLAERQVRSSR